MRQAQPALWRQSQYVPLDVKGGGGRVLAFRRVFGDESALVLLSVRNEAAQQWPAGEVFAEAEVDLPALGAVRDVLTDRLLQINGTTSVSLLLGVGPAAVFVAAA